MRLKDFKGLWWYVVVLVVAMSFFTYSQAVGWLWVGATSNTPPSDPPSDGVKGNRYFLHK